MSYWSVRARILSLKCEKENKAEGPFQSFVYRYKFVQKFRIKFIMQDQRWPWEWERVGIPIPILTIPGNIVKGNKNFHRGYIPIIPGNIGNENEEFHRGFIPTNTGNFGNGNDF